MSNTINWFHAFMVEPAPKSYLFNDLGSARSTEEFEPLGQRVFAQDPAEFPDPPPNDMVSFWEDMQWQCEPGEAFYGSFDQMPWHCQNSSLLSRSLNGDTLYKIIEVGSSPKKVRAPKNPKTDPEGESVPSPTEKILSFAISSSAKPIELTSTGADFFAVIQKPKISMPDDYKDASWSATSFFNFNNKSSGVQLPKCIRDFLRPHFPSIKVNGTEYNPVDDARFISGMPSFAKDKTAIVLGLFDIHYNSNDFIFRADRTNHQ
ncbi:MAG: hypothetical protein KIS76_01815 [Pyrinomonadaceae bacterium]|nr:hypothetical protein [Pyrinomonadaceae bacterium]